MFEVTLEGQTVSVFFDMWNAARFANTLILNYPGSCAINIKVVR